MHTAEKASKCLKHKNKKKPRWVVSAFHNREPTIWLSQHQMAGPQPLTSDFSHKPWEGDNGSVSSATHVTSAPTTSSLPSKARHVPNHWFTQ